MQFVNGPKITESRQKCKLLDFAVERFLLQNRIELHQLQAVGRILPVLLGDVAGSARHAGLLVLGTFQNDLDPVAFALLGHCSLIVLLEFKLEFHTGINALLMQFLQISVKAQFVDRAHGARRYLQRYPFSRFRHEETLLLQVGQKAAARFAVGVRNVVPGNRAFSR